MPGQMLITLLLEWSLQELVRATERAVVCAIRACLLQQMATRLRQGVWELQQQHESCLLQLQQAAHGQRGRESHRAAKRCG